MIVKDDAHVIERCLESVLSRRPSPAQLDSTRDGSSATTLGRWVNSHDLMTGDMLIATDGRTHSIETIEMTEVTNHAVFNLAVRDTPSFAIGTEGFLVHNKSFCELYAEAYNLGTDGLADLRKSVSAARKAKLGADTVLATHGHHIVHAIGFGGIRGYWNGLSKDILVHWGIDLLDDPSKIGPNTPLHNLCIAPFKYVHSTAYTESVYKLLSRATDKDTAILILKDIKDALHEGKYLTEIYDDWGVT